MASRRGSYGAGLDRARGTAARTEVASRTDAASPWIARHSTMPELLDARGVPDYIHGGWRLRPFRVTNLKHETAGAFLLLNAIDLPRSHVLSYDATDRAHYRRPLGSLPRRLVAPVLARICERSRPRCAAVPKPSTTARQRFSTSCPAATAVRHVRRRPAGRAHRGRLFDVLHGCVRARHIANVARDGGASNDPAY